MSRYSPRQTQTLNARPVTTAGSNGPAVPVEPGRLHKSRCHLSHVLELCRGVERPASRV